MTQHLSIEVLKIFTKRCVNLSSFFRCITAYIILADATTDEQVSTVTLADLQRKLPLKLLMPNLTKNGAYFAFSVHALVVVIKAAAAAVVIKPCSFLTVNHKPYYSQMTK